MGHILCAIHFIDIDHKPEWSLSNVYFLGHRVKVYSGFFLSCITHSLSWSLCIISRVLNTISDTLNRTNYKSVYLNEAYALKKACGYTLKKLQQLELINMHDMSFILVFKTINERNLLFSHSSKQVPF